MNVQEAEKELEQMIQKEEGEGKVKAVPSGSKARNGKK